MHKTRQCPSQTSFEGSSVVFVNKSDAVPEEDGDTEHEKQTSTESCFALLAGKLAATEDARNCRALLQKVKGAINTVIC
jgi:hypothetical protein